MDLDSIAAVKRGEYSIERFRGQTYIHIPLSMGDPVPPQRWSIIAQAYFQEAELDNTFPIVVRGASKKQANGSSDWRRVPLGTTPEPDEFAHWTIEIPSVLALINTAPSHQQPEWHLPELFMQRILEKDF